MKLFLKSTISSRSIFSDFWVIVLCSFVFTFVLLFSTSMLHALEGLERYFVSPRVSVSEVGASIDDIKKDIESLRAADGVESADAVCSRVGVIENDKFFHRVVLKRVGQSYFDKRARIINAEIDFDVKNPLLISKSLAHKYGLAYGDRVGFVTSDKQKRARLLTVAGFYDTGLGDFDTSFAFEVVLDENTLIEETGVVIEVTDKKSEKFSVFSRRNISSDNNWQRFRDVVDYGKLRFSQSDENLYQSFNSVKFILYLFIIIVILYFFVAIKNFDQRNRYNFDVFRVLGDGNLKFKRVVSCSIITLLSMAIGSALGIVLVLFAPFLLSFLTRIGVVDFTYYFTNFSVNIFNLDLAKFFAINIIISAIIYFTIERE